MPETAPASPLALALRRFASRRGAQLGIALCAAFALVALYAPLLASDVAIVWWDDAGFRLPLLADLFNRRSYPKHHDLLFSVAGLLLPAIATGWWLLRRRWSASRRVLAAAGLVLCGWLLAMLPLLPDGRGGWQAVWSDRPSSACTAEAARASGAWTIFPLVPHRYDAAYAGAVLKPPGTVNPASGRGFLLGTDQVGFDVFARMAFGTRISLTIGLLATGIALAIGTVIGALSGYLGGWVDLVLQRLVEIMMCFPTFILVLVVVAMLGRDIFIITWVLGLTGWAGAARLVRGEFLAQSGRDYVLACRAAGLPAARIMFRHVLPNCMTPLLISATFGVAGSVGLESGLAFIGLGDANVPSWGMLLNQGRENIAFGWLIWVPGLAVFLLVMSLNMVGNGLREALDPKASP
ncbi:MAG: ABC transporter permease [Planctomycetes bacterium]|nr:ABC transporter permease [Planctomycetota bacterium]